MIAVTGAAGFIGANLAARLAELGNDLLLVDHPLTPAKCRNLVGLRHFRFMEHDLFLSSLGEEHLIPSAIFHLGACSSTTESDWDYLARNNIDYSKKLWSWCAQHQKPLLYASSAATYGDGAKGFDDRIPASALRPLNLYGRSKNDFDIWVQEQLSAGRPTPTGWAGLKFFNVYGPLEYHKGSMASVVWHAYRQIRATGKMRLFKSTDPAYPDGGQRRDFVFVADCVDHLIWLWKHPEVCGIFNSGTGKARTFADLVNAVFAALKQPIDIEFIDMPAELRGKYQNFTQAEMSRLRSAGYNGVTTDLESGVAAYVAELKTAD